MVACELDEAPGDERKGGARWASGRLLATPSPELTALPAGLRWTSFPVQDLADLQGVLQRCASCVLNVSTLRGTRSCFAKVSIE